MGAAGRVTHPSPPRPVAVRTSPALTLPLHVWKGYTSLTSETCGRTYITRPNPALFTSGRVTHPSPPRPVAVRTSPTLPPSRLEGLHIPHLRDLWLYVQHPHCPLHVWKGYTSLTSETCGRTYNTHPAPFTSGRVTHPSPPRPVAVRTSSALTPPPSRLDIVIETALLIPVWPEDIFIFRQQMASTNYHPH